MKVQTIDEYYNELINMGISKIEAKRVAPWLRKSLIRILGNFYEWKSKQEQQ